MKIEYLKGAELERHSLWQKVLRLIIVPIFNHIIPEKKLRETVSKLSTAGAQAVSRAGSTHAMESFYFGSEQKMKLSQRIREYITHQVLSATKATRNRLKTVEGALYREFLERTQRMEAIRVYAFGGGTCRSFINVLARLKREGIAPQVRITNVDLDQSAHRAGQTLAREHGYVSEFEWLQGSVLDARNFSEANKVDIVEIIGLLEYLDDEAAVAVLAQAYTILNAGALLVAANVRPTNEATFYRKIGWPPMYYRTPEKMSQLLEQAGFESGAIEIKVEPVCLHSICLVRR